ncbi:hypothetical protein CLOM621_07060 [Clostridium sp. M62/1]|nr:hypothetical protein CLOM621_07060 [Clostridium sp. M62/1]
MGPASPDRRFRPCRGDLGKGKKTLRECFPRRDFDRAGRVEMCAG